MTLAIQVSQKSGQGKAAEKQNDGVAKFYIKNTFLKS